MGVQWGFFWWSESQYKWVGGVGGAEPPPVFGFTDNFDDNVTDPEKWEKTYTGNATATETGQKLENNHPDGGNSAGYVTTNIFNFNDAYVNVDVDSEVTYDIYNCLYLAFSKVTDANPVTLSDWLRIIYIKKSSTLGVSKKVSGDIEDLFNQVKTGVTKLRLRLVGGVLYADYYDGTWKTAWSGSPPHTYSNVYIYIVSASSSGHTGKAWFDNFVLTK